MNYEKKRREGFKKRLKEAGPEVRFRTLKYRPGGKDRIVAATMQMDGGIYHLGLAFCSNNDRFEKLKGQVIALGRLIKDPIEFERAKDRPVKWSVAAIAVDIAGKREVRWMEGIRPEDLV